MRPGSRLLRKPASCDQSCRSTSAISTAERTGASNRSPAHTQGPIAQAASAQKMFLTRSATDVLQGLPACRQHCPHSAKISAPSFNPASMRSRSRLQSGPRRVMRPHRTLQIQRVAETHNSNSYGDAVTDDSPANNDAAISKLEDTVRELETRHETLIGKLSNPTEEMMLAGALAHNAGLRPMRVAITAGEAKRIFVAMTAVLKETII